MGKPVVYLAGPVGGCTYDGCVSWREYAQKRLAEHGIIGISPMRAKEHLKSCAHIDRQDDGALQLYRDPLACPKGISNRDRYDCTHCNMVLMNLVGAKEVSKGSMIEVGWADVSRIPIILAMESVGNVHAHAMMEEIPAFRVETLDQALDLAIAVLKDYVG